MKCMICKQLPARIPNNGNQDPCKNCVKLVLDKLKKSASVDEIGAALKRIQTNWTQYPPIAIAALIVVELQKPPPKYKAKSAPFPVAAAAAAGGQPASGVSAMAAAEAGANAPAQQGLLTPIDRAQAQLEIDRFYASTLRLKHLDVFVHASDAGGFGDLINCLQTSTILVDEEEGWRATPLCGHKDFAVMARSFTKLRPALNVPALQVNIATAAQLESGEDGTIIEYSTADPAMLTPSLRCSGLAPHEMGIMINESLRAPLPLSKLKLSQPDLKAILESCAKAPVTPRLFFGYGAGQHLNPHFNLLLDRVFHDNSITSAVILPVNHLEDYLQKYIKTNDHTKAIPGLRESYKSEELTTCKIATFRLGQRVIQVINMKSKCMVPYEDMLQLWRAADRSFTITEGDQSFSEAISAGIPMAYQLWKRDGKNVAHKQALFDALLSACATHYPTVHAFLKNCKDYAGSDATPSGAAAGAAPAVASPVQRKMELLKQIIGDCNSPKFINDYVRFTEELAEERSISRHLQGFVQRLWLRKAHEADLLPELNNELKTLFTLEDANDAGAMRVPLYQLKERIREANNRLFSQPGGLAAKQGAASASGAALTAAAVPPGTSPESSRIMTKRIEAIGQGVKGASAAPPSMPQPVLSLIADYLPENAAPPANTKTDAS